MSKRARFGSKVETSVLNKIVPPRRLTYDEMTGKVRSGDVARNVSDMPLIIKKNGVEVYAKQRQVQSKKGMRISLRG